MKVNIVCTPAYAGFLFWGNLGSDNIQRSDLEGNNLTTLLDSSDGLNLNIGLTFTLQEASPVPEPTTLVLLALSLLGFTPLKKYFT